MSTGSPRSAQIRLLGALAGASLMVAACGDDDTSARETSPDGAGPAVIVTTTAAPDDPEPIDPPATDPPANDPEPSDPESTEPSTTEPPTTEPPTTEPSTTEPGMVGAPDVAFTQIAVLNQPIGLAVRPGEPTLYVVEQAGRITALEPDGTTRTVLDVTDLTAARGERGLLGLTFSPDGSLAFTNHTDVDTGATIVSEFGVESDGVFDRDSQRVLLEVAQPFGNHNGGHLVTGPDGLLYVGMGDGGSGGDPERFALDLTTLLGKLLRIDPAPTGDMPYTVPDGNPFVGVDGARPEIFAIGLRNPWKFGFDPATDDLWITDVGQNRFEEINHVPDPGNGSVPGAGLSFGWSAFEGTDRFNDDVDPEGHTEPVLTYDHSEGECSISGGSPYRGEAIPDLVGGYVYGDFCSGRVFAFDLAGRRNVLIGQLPSVSAVLPGPADELYVISITGPVHRIDPA